MTTGPCSKVEERRSYSHLFKYLTLGRNERPIISSNYSLLLSGILMDKFIPSIFQEPIQIIYLKIIIIIADPD